MLTIWIVRRNFYSYLFFFFCESHEEPILTWDTQKDDDKDEILIDLPDIKFHKVVIFT